MSERDIRKAIIEKDQELLELFRDMRGNMVRIFDKYHRLGLAMERMMLQIDKTMDSLEKEIGNEPVGKGKTKVSPNSSDVG